MDIEYCIYPDCLISGEWRGKACEHSCEHRAESARNARVQARYDELIREGKHGHYETLFRVVREEVERAMKVGINH